MKMKPGAHHKIRAMSRNKPEARSIMKRISILLSIDGSAESRSAAHIAWQLARQTESSITAQYVVDSAAVWKFLSYSSAGFIGSGPYMEANSQINEALRSIADSVLLSYNSQAEGQGIHNCSYIDEGDIVNSICDRAKEHDLVVIGHSAGRENDIFLELGKICPCPVLIIQKNTTRWSRICVLLTDETVNEDTIWDISEFGNALGLSTELYLHSSSGKEQTLVWANRLACLRGLPVVAIRHAYDGYVMGAETVLVVPIDNKTRATANEAIKTYLSMDNPAIVLWPAEMAIEENQPTKLAPKSMLARKAS
jgi:nucleotide-binding universal stress UspA family protein